MKKQKWPLYNNALKHQSLVVKGENQKPCLAVNPWVSTNVLSNSLDGPYTHEIPIGQ